MSAARLKSRLSRIGLAGLVALALAGCGPVRPDRVSGQPGDLELPSAWQKTRGAGQVVAILDTGISQHLTEHCGCLSGAFNAITGGENAKDENGHGSGLAAILSGDASVGQTGIAPDAKILAVRVTDRHGWSSSESLVAGIDWAVAHGATVVNISLGSQTPDETLNRHIKTAMNKGITVVAAAGDGGDSFAYFPAALDGVVAAVAGTNAGKVLSDSNYPDKGLRVSVEDKPSFRLSAAGKLTKKGPGKTSQAAIVLSGLVALSRAEGSHCRAAFNAQKFVKQYSLAQRDVKIVPAPSLFSHCGE